MGRAEGGGNLSKHGISFEEAETIFGDPLLVNFYDPDHSHDEHRYIIIGESRQGRLLMASYTERGTVMRLINSREVTRQSVKLMKKVKTEMEDELRPEYGLRSLHVRKLGPGRRSFGEAIRLEPDVAEVFPNAESVNEALRFLMRVTRESKLTSPDSESGA